MLGGGVGERRIRFGVVSENKGEDDSGVINGEGRGEKSEKYRENKVLVEG
jgi:hypothetical protein